MMILEGYRLSFSAWPSRKNSGEKMTRFVANFCCSVCVWPTGMVDFMTMEERTGDNFYFMTHFCTPPLINRQSQNPRCSATTPAVLLNPINQIWPTLARPKCRSYYYVRVP